MSTAVLEPDSESTIPADAPDYMQYRALCSAAVASLIVGILSLLAFLYPWFALIPVVGVALGIYGLRKIRANPAELTGEPVAKAGLILSLAFGIGGPAYLAYEYATEVPEWAERISYAQLQPDPAIPEQAVPPAAIALNGKKVFIKGYIYPGENLQHGLKQFVLCADQGDCCFGGNPKVTDRIEVNLADPLTVSYSQKMFRVAGTFRLEPTQAPGGLGAVYYHIDAEYVK